MPSPGICKRAIVLHLLAKYGRATPDQIADRHLASFPELRTKRHIKQHILKQAQGDGLVKKKHDKNIINPKTNTFTWFWEIVPELKSEFEQVDLLHFRTQDYPASLRIEPEFSVPLLGRTGLYGKFRKFAPKDYIGEQVLAPDN